MSKQNPHCGKYTRKGPSFKGKRLTPPNKTKKKIWVKNP